MTEFDFVGEARVQQVRTIRLVLAHLETDAVQQAAVFEEINGDQHGALLASQALLNALSAGLADAWSNSISKAQLAAFNVGLQTLEVSGRSAAIGLWLRMRVTRRTVLELVHLRVRALQLVDTVDTRDFYHLTDEWCDVAEEKRIASLHGGPEPLGPIGG